MKKLFIFCIVALMILASCFMVSGCADQATIVSQNISKQADNFNVIRRVTVINCIQGDTIFVMEGKLSIETTSEKLYILVENADGSYAKHIIGLSDNVTYTVEDINGNYVDRYNFTINYNPKMWIPWTIENVD